MSLWDCYQNVRSFYEEPDDEEREQHPRVICRRCNLDMGCHKTGTVIACDDCGQVLKAELDIPPTETIEFVEFPQESLNDLSM